jgi:hypothetical protein
MLTLCARGGPRTSSTAFLPSHPLSLGLLLKLCRLICRLGCPESTHCLSQACTTTPIFPGFGSGLTGIVVCDSVSVSQPFHLSAHPTSSDARGLTVSSHLDTLRVRRTFQIKGQIVNTASIVGQVVCVARTVHLS